MLDALFQLFREIFFFAAYVNNTNSFPERLTPGEEKDCLARCAKGDEEARSMLIEHNLRLVAHIAKKFSCNGRNNDDIISIGTIGLIKAVSTYDMHKGTALATYAARCIENAILSLRTIIRRLSIATILSQIIGILLQRLPANSILWCVQRGKRLYMPRSTSTAFI